MRKDIERTIIGAKDSEKKADSKYKKLFELPEIMAPILKYTIDEYKGCSIEDIISYIDRKSIDTKKPVAPVPRIKPGTESKSYTETDLTYDVYFLSAIPDGYSDSINDKQIIIDYELQGVYNGIIPYRSRYYESREVSDQLGLYLKDDDYCTLKKVYTIWLCYGDVPKKYRNTILKYRPYGVEIKDIGKEKKIDLPENMDSGTIVLIMRDSKYYSKGNREYSHPLFRYLDGLFHGDMEICKEFLGETIFEKVEGSVKKVSSITRGFVLEGIKYGKEQGIDIGKKLGEKRGIDIGKKLGEKRGIDIGEKREKEEIAEKLMKQGILTFEQIIAITGLSDEKLNEISKNL